jgi:hypothetical protein
MTLTAAISARRVFLIAALLAAPLALAPAAAQPAAGMSGARSQPSAERAEPRGGSVFERRVREAARARTERGLSGNASQPRERPAPRTERPRAQTVPERSERNRSYVDPRRDGSYAGRNPSYARPGFRDPDLERGRERRDALRERWRDRAEERAEDRADRRADHRADRRDRRDDRYRDWRRDRAHDWRSRHHPRYGHSYDRWDRYGWRSHPRYDWHRWRAHNRHVFRLGRYYPPFAGYSYNRLRVGFHLEDRFFSGRYHIGDPWRYRLPSHYGPYRWVRYYDDIVLVDLYTGRVVDVIYDFFW